MDRVHICHTTFRLPSLLHDERKFIEPEPIGTIVPFPDWMLRKLAAALPGTGVIGLNGPLGSGKKGFIEASLHLTRARAQFV